MPKQLRAIARTALRPLPLAIGLVCANGAMAQEGANPYYFGASQAFKHDDNVYRRAENNPAVPVVADTVSTTSLLGGIDQPFGRQRFYANGTVSTNRHKNQDQLNNTSYGLSTGLDWSTIERLSGNIRLSANQNLANYGDADASTTTDRNLQKSRQFSANARYGIAASLGLEGGVNHGAVEYSADDDLRTVRQNGANLGLRWGRGGPMSVGLSGRVSTAKYPRVAVTATTFSPDEVKRRDLQASVTYTPTGISTFTGHLSLTKETHSLAGRSNFSGVTGGVSWDYRLSGKLAFNAALNRDTGTATTFMQQQTSPPLPLLPPTYETVRVDTNRISNTAVVAFNYEVTGKIQVNGNVRHLASSDGGSTNQSLTSVGFGANYQPTRTISLGCNVGRETRASVYAANTMGCKAEIAFR